jgi:glycosyltransferase involved in cell wall biosynthesis
MSVFELHRAGCRSALSKKAADPMTGVSIIIPAYEAWPLLRRTLSSVIHDVRTLGVPCEVVVVDNESDPSLVLRIRRLFGPHEVRIHRRTGLDGSHFRPGSARNIGIDMARYDCLVFLDSDCVPSRDLFAHYWTRLQTEPDCVLLGHRVFIDATRLHSLGVALDRQLLDTAPHVPSASNYGLTQDRRMPDLLRLEAHPRPYDCLFACNFAVHRRSLGELRFDPVYDGHWGYEDIHLGFRLHQAGRRFRYLGDAFVYHQEGGPLSVLQRAHGRERNFPIAAAGIPGFASYRASSSRPATYLGAWERTKKRAQKSLVP